MRLQHLAMIACAGLSGYCVYEQSELRRELRSIERATERRNAVPEAAPRAPQLLVVTRPVEPPPAGRPAADDGRKELPVDPPALPEPPSEAESRARLRSSFEAETVDGAWARETARTVEASLRGRPGITGAGTVDCKSVLCRVEVSHRDGAQKAAFERDITALGGRLWPGEMFFEASDENPFDDRSTVLFLLRVGAHSPLEPLE